MLIFALNVVFSMAYIRLLQQRDEVVY